MSKAGSEKADDFVTVAGSILRRVTGTPKTNDHKFVMGVSSGGSTSLSSSAALSIVERRFREMHTAEAAAAAKKLVQE